MVVSGPEGTVRCGTADTAQAPTYGGLEERLMLVRVASSCTPLDGLRSNSSSPNKCL